MSEAPAKREKPEWLKIRPGGGRQFARVRRRLKTLDLHTVCEEAHCPNRGECWGGGTATVILMGDVCTRGCRFCAVKTGNPKGVLDAEEPDRVAEAVAELGLTYVVLTSVDRDDLSDGGAGHFAETIRRIKARAGKTRVEALIPDFSGNINSLRRLLDAGPDVLAHNVEVTPRLTPLARDRRASWERSLAVLVDAKRLHATLLTKTSLMTGLGEDEAELLAAMRQIREAGVDILTIGQYLQPTPRHLPVLRYYSPQEFAFLESEGRRMGFAYIAAGPLVRSSYRAGELFIKGVLENRATQPLSEPERR